MLRIRKLLLTAALILGLGSLGASLAYGWYLRSELHCRSIEQRVSTFLDLPVDVGAVRPSTLDAMVLEDVQAFLPQQRDRIFECDLAIWQLLPVRGTRAHVLEFKDGRLSIGSDQWQDEDYRRVLESSFAHDFAGLNLDRVMLWGMDVQVLRPGWRLTIGKADGLVDFSSRRGPARAHLRSKDINGHRVEQAIQCSASFSSGEALVMHRVELDVPEMPVAHLQLDDLLGAPITTGTFVGKLTYSESGEPSLEVTGAVRDLSLGELTPRLPRGPLSGRLDHVHIDHARFASGRLEQVKFRGQLSELSLGDFASLLDRAGITGRMQLTVAHGQIYAGRIAELQARGTVDGIDLKTLTQALDVGTVTGRLELDLKRFHITDDQVVSAEIIVRVRPPDRGAPTVSRTFLTTTAEQILGASLPELPFEDLQYVRLGARLIIDGQRLRIEGLYGDDQDVILTVRLFGQETPLVLAPEQAFILGDLIAMARKRVRGVDLREWLGAPLP